MNYKIANQVKVQGDATRIGTRFKGEIQRILRSYPMFNIIETGTYDGAGSTAAIIEAMHPDAYFFSIEVCPYLYSLAVARFRTVDCGLILRNGLSIPRNLLPTIEQIKEDYVFNRPDKSIFIDHKDSNRAINYFKETNYPEAPDNLLGAALQTFNPQFILLDSAGHIGYIEFQYLIARLQDKCIIALDDIGHIKHYRSYQQILTDSRFKILASGDEKFGYCIAEFKP